MAKKRKVRTAKVRTATKPVSTEAAFTDEQPTPEQRRQRPFAIESIVEHGQVIGRSFKRQPLYMTLSKTSDRLTSDEIAALDLYREMNDRSDRSFTKSCLDLDGNGSLRKPDAIVHVNNAIRQARDMIARLEASIGPIVSTLRAVALDDRTFSDIAMERFGSRTRSWIKVDEPVMKNGRPLVVDGKVQKHAVHQEELVPRSGRHREIVRDEYRQAVRKLAAAVREYSRATEIEEVWVGTLESGGCRIYRGAMGPKGAFRLRGTHSAIGATFAELAQDLHGELEFPDYPAAKTALAAAALGRLIDVDGLGIPDQASAA